MDDSATEGNLPNGSGDNGSMGDGNSLSCFGGGIGGERACSSSSSFFRRSVSDCGSIAGRLVDIYDLGADVETPLTAKEGGEDGLSSFPSELVRLSLIDANGTAGQDCPAKFLSRYRPLVPTLTRRTKLTWDSQVIQQDFEEVEEMDNLRLYPETGRTGRANLEISLPS